MSLVLAASSTALADESNVPKAEVVNSGGMTFVILPDMHPSWTDNLTLSGYVQPQLVVESYNDAASPNPPGVGPNETTVRSNGTTTNPDFFRLRRDRLKAEYRMSDYGKFVFEIEPLTMNTGTNTIARNIEAVGIAHWMKEPGFDLKTDFGAGIFKVPFGFEIQQSDADRPFIERSWGERNMMPGEFDTGVRAYSTAHYASGARSTLQLAITNGNLQGMPTSTLMPSLDKGKDGYVRISSDVGHVDFGVSGTLGQGVIADATAGTVSHYDRGGVNAEFGVHDPLVPSLGMTKLFMEATVGSNLDKGLYYSFAMPKANGPALTEVNVMGRVEQDLGKWFTLGARYDRYTPNTNVGNNPHDGNARHTIGGVGVVHFTKGLQFMAEFDHAVDNVHAAGSVAPNKQIETGSGVLQARF